MSNEQLYRPNLRGPLRAQIGNTNAWAGRTTVASGSVSATVSSNIVNSDSVILFSTEVASVGIGITSGYGLVVNSIVSATSFALSNASGVAVPWDQIAMWTIIKPT